MRIVITGHHGFIGSHVWNSLAADDHDLMGADRKVGSDVNKRSTTAAIRDFEPELIVHLASSVSTPGSVERPIDTFRDTVATTSVVMENARLLGSAVHLTSSVKARDGRTPYGAAKQMAEIWAIEYCNAYDIPLVINRPGTVYGPGQEGSLESGWVAWFLKAKETDQKVTIHGSGRQVRDILYVADYVKLIRRQIDDYVLGRSSWNGQVWDVGGGYNNTTTVLGLAQYLDLRYEFGPPRYGDAHTYVGVNDYPGWAPETYWRDVLEDSDPDPVSWEAAVRP